MQNSDLEPAPTGRDELSRFDTLELTFAEQAVVDENANEPMGTDRGYHSTVPWRSMNRPLPPESGSVASATIASVPSVTVCGPEWALKSVAV